MFGFFSKSKSPVTKSPVNETESPVNIYKYEAVGDKYEAIGKNGEKYSYKGKMENGQPHGKGTMVYMTYKDDDYYGTDTYEGNWQNGKRHDQGTMEYQGDEYEGNWQNDQFVNGTITYKNGNVYNGPCKDDKPNGEGVMTYKNGNIYKGEFDNGVPNGKGVMTYKNHANITVYNGYFEYTKPYGQGNAIINYKNGDEYSGNVTNGIPNGEGTMRYKNGDVYSGNVVNGERNGVGTMTYKFNNDTCKNYTGNWKNDKPNDEKGVMIYKNDFKYTGNFVNGKRNGVGTMNLDTLYTFNCNWVDDKRVGQGTMTINIASKGESEHCNKTGTIIYSGNYTGIWADDKIKSVVYNYTEKDYDTGQIYTYAKYEGGWKENEWSKGIDNIRGVREGEGTMTYYKKDGKISLCESVWENDSLKPINPNNRDYTHKPYRFECKLTYYDGTTYKGVVYNSCSLPPDIQNVIDYRVNYQYINRRNLIFHDNTFSFELIKGTMTYINGDVYEGEWLFNSRSSEGTMTYANGDVYKGDWSYGEWSITYGKWEIVYRDGQGTMIYANGDKYEGKWRNDKRNGKGTMKYADGSVYEGEWENDEKISSKKDIINNSNGGRTSGTRKLYNHKYKRGHKKTHRKHLKRSHRKGINKGHKRSHKK
jgi:hypothetical protein